MEGQQPLKMLANVRSQVKAGQGCIALVGGKAGKGNTLLTERFVVSLRSSARALWSACNHHNCQQPLDLFLNILLQNSVKKTLFGLFAQLLSTQTTRLGDTNDTDTYCL